MYGAIAISQILYQALEIHSYKAWPYAQRANMQQREKQATHNEEL